MECNKHICSICNAIFRDLNLNQISNVSNFEFRTFSRTFVIDLANQKGFSVFGPIIVLYFWQIFQNEMSHFNNILRVCFFEVCTYLCICMYICTYISSFPKRILT